MLIIYIFRIQCTCMMWKGKTVCERTERANRTIRFLSNQGTLREPNVKPTELNKKTNHEVIKRPIVCTLENMSCVKNIRNISTLLPFITFAYFKTKNGCIIAQQSLNLLFTILHNTRISMCISFPIFVHFFWCLIKLLITYVMSLRCLVWINRFSRLANLPLSSPDWVLSGASDCFHCFRHLNMILTEKSWLNAYLHSVHSFGVDVYFL